MRRVAAVVSLTAVLLLACGSFGADPSNPVDSSDSGPIPGHDAGGDASPNDTDDTDRTDAGPVRACQSKFEDNFERDALLQGPMAELEKNGTNVVAILDQGTDTRVLHVETKATVEEVGPHSAFLSTGPIAAPESKIDCHFRMKPLTDFATEGGALNDVFVFRLRYADGRKINLRASYTRKSGQTQGIFMVRDDRFGPDGKCLDNQCPVKIEFAPASTQKKGDFNDVKVSMTYDSFKAVDGVIPVERTGLNLEKPESIEILLGVVAFSPYAQEAYFDDLSCALDCE